MRWMLVGGMFAVLALPACACEAVGCIGSVQLAFEADSWMDGDYRIRVDVGDEEPWVCTFALPVDEPVACDPFSAVVVDEEALRVLVPIWLLPRDYADVGVVLEGPESVLLDEVVSPEWKTERPNGPHCGGACASGEWTFAL